MAQETASTEKSSGFMEKFSEKMLPVANALGSNKYLVTLRDTFAAVTPLLIVGSMFTLVANFPITAWTDWIGSVYIGDQTLQTLIAVPASCTVSMMSIFVAFLMGYNFAEHEKLEDRVATGITSLLSWILLLPLYTSYTPDGSTETYSVSSIPLDWVGAKGVFVAIIVGFLSVKIYAYFIHKDITIKMPEGVPPSVSRAFTSLIPTGVVVLVMWVVRIIFVATPWDNAFDFIYTFMQVPLQNLGGTVWAELFAYFFAHILWFFGIHGVNIVGSVYEPVLTVLSAENLEATTAGLEAPNIINLQFQQLFATMGGAGSGLSLLIAIFVACKSERLLTVARLSIAPGIFGINEPVVFGIPIVMNPILLVPFVLTPCVNIVLTYLVMAAGLVPVCSGVSVPWTTPPIISGFLVSGWQGAVWQVIELAYGTLIYLPFIKTLDNQFLKEQAEAEAKKTAESSDFDDIDLDSIDLDTL